MLWSSNTGHSQDRGKLGKRGVDHIRLFYESQERQKVIAHSRFAAGGCLDQHGSRPFLAPSLDQISINHVLLSPGDRWDYCGEEDPDAHGPGKSSAATACPGRPGLLESEPVLHCQRGVRGDSR